MSNATKGYALSCCGVCCAIIGIVLLIIGGIIPPTLNRAFIQGYKDLAVVDGYDDNKPEDQFKNSRKCAAYKSPRYTKFDDAPASERNWEIDNKDCEGGSSKLYLYHVKNADAVMKNGADVEVERRGPWIFKTNSRQYYVNFLKDGTERENGRSRSWDVVDEAATKKACPKCGTKHLCVSWPKLKDASSYPTADKCKKGTIEGDADYNKITTLNLADQVMLSSLILTREFIKKWVPGASATPQTDDQLFSSTAAGVMNTVFGDTGAIGTGTGGSGGKNAMYQGMSIAFSHFKYGLASAALGEGYKAAFAAGMVPSNYTAVGAELNALPASAPFYMPGSMLYPFKLEEFNPTIRNMTIYPGSSNMEVAAVTALLGPKSAFKYSLQDSTGIGTWLATLEKHNPSAAIRQGATVNLKMALADSCDCAVETYHILEIASAVDKLYTWWETQQGGV